MKITIPKKPKTKTQTRCGDVRELGPEPRRCAAAHVDDRSPCEGTVHAVEVTDMFARHVRGCLWHGTLLYASLSQAVMFPVFEDPATVDAARRIAYRLRSLYWADRDNAPEARTPH